MILEKQTQSLIYQEGTSQATVGMSLDMDSAQVLMQMLSKNLYSDAIGSTIRECASNALDSHRRSGVLDAIIVGLKASGASGSYEFTVEDFGTGLDASDVENIISKYGKSTKRNSNTELGMMGLGFKAPLAYASSFYFTCRKDGIERKYMMYEGEDTNSIDLLYQKETTERNGVKIIIPVKVGDRYEFLKKIKEQLAYFQNVYFDVSDIDNDFKIHRSEHYQSSELATSNQLHICLDDVYYPIDWEKLEIRTPISLKMALRFSLTDGLFPTPNRESIRYTTEAKTKIKEKIEALADHFMKLYNDTVNDDAEFETVYSFYNSKVIQVRNPINDNGWLDITELSKFSTLKPKSPKLKDAGLLDASKLVNRSRYILQEYQYRHVIRTGYKKQFCNFNGMWDREITFNSYGKKLTERTIYLFNDTISERSKRYIKETFDKEAYFVKKTSSIVLWRKTHNTKIEVSKDDFSTYYGLLELYNYPRNTWRERIKQFRGVVDSLVSTFLNFDDIIIPEQWIINDKKARSKAKPKVDSNGYVKVKGDINGKIGTQLERWVSGQNCKFVPKVWKGSNLHKNNRLIVYGKDSDRIALDKWWGALCGSVDFVILSDRETRLIETYNLHNWMHISKFLEGKNQPYRRAISASLIESLMNNNSHTFAASNGVNSSIKLLKGLSEDLILLRSYRNKNRHHAFIDNDTVKKAVSEGNVDTTVHDVYQRVSKLLDKHKFIQCIQSDRLYHNGDNYDQMFKDLCRYHHIRMIPECYNITQGWLPVDADGQLSLFVA